MLKKLYENDAGNKKSFCEFQQENIDQRCFFGENFEISWLKPISPVKKVE